MCSKPGTSPAKIASIIDRNTSFFITIRTRVCVQRENTMQTSSLSTPRSSSLTLSAGLQIAAAIILGAVLLYGVGFASSDVAHNAAHDSRHSFAFPCH